MVYWLDRYCNKNQFICHYRLTRLSKTPASDRHQQILHDHDLGDATKRWWLTNQWLHH